MCWHQDQNWCSAIYSWIGTIFCCLLCCRCCDEHRGHHGGHHEHHGGHHRHHGDHHGHHGERQVIITRTVVQRWEKKSIVIFSSALHSSLIRSISAVPWLTRPHGTKNNPSTMATVPTVNIMACGWGLSNLDVTSRCNSFWQKITLLNDK